MRTSRLVLPVCLAGMLVAFALLAAAPASAERYVAMGDSYSAGTGLDASDHNWGTAAADVDCHRSPKAYGPLIRGALGAASSFRFAACTGARTNHITTSGQNGNPAQSERLGNDTLFATISIGGNDAGFGDVLLQCGYPMVSCNDDINNAQSYITNTLPGVLNGVYSKIRTKAPNASVGVLGYPRLFPADGDDCSAATFFSADEISRLNQTADMLSDVTRARARAYGFSFVDSRPAFLGHAWCENEWINGLSNPTHKSYHPNAPGYQGFAGITRAAMLAAPSPSFQRGPNGRIAFTASRDGNTEIYAANADGSHPTNLTNNLAADESPVFSPDGSKIAFASNRAGGSAAFDIYVMNWNGTGLQRLTNAAGDDYDPSFSPNGKEIVFRSDRDGDNEIYKLNAEGGTLWDGSAVHKLTSNTVSDFLPSFSPDGAEIVFQRFSAGSGTGLGNEIFKMNADGQGQINLTANSSSINDGGAAFSPDGSQIAFHSNRDGNFEIYTMAATGGAATRRTNNSGSDRNAAWAPSGTQIAFQSDRGGADRIYTMTSSGGSQTRRTNNGGIDSAPSWQGDARPPESEITAGPPPVSNQSSASFSFTSDEAGSSFECRLGTGSWSACGSPFTTGSLGDGTHQFSLRAIDPSGNVESSLTTRSFSIDTQAKVSRIISGPSGPTLDPEPAFGFDSETPNVTFECRLVEAGTPNDWESCTSPWQPGILADGEYRFEVRATDQVANVEDPPQGVDFQVDTLAPNASLVVGPAATGNEARPTMEMGSDEAGVTFECLLEAAGETGDWQACGSPFQPATPLADGQWSFSVRATDLAGNTGPETTAHQFTIDTAAPTSQVVSGPGPRHNSTAITVAFDSPDTGAGFECRLDTLDDADWQHCDSPFTATGLTHGKHEFQVRATDQAGNIQSLPTSHEFGIDTSPAYEVTSQPDDPTTVNRPKFEFTSDDPGAIFTCRLDEGDWKPCGSPYEPTLGGPALADGQHRMEIRGTDSFGDTTQLPAINWLIDAGPPMVTIVSAPPALDNSTTAGFVIDPRRSGVTLMCKIDGWDWAPCPGDSDDGAPRQVSFSGLLDATHQLLVRGDGPLSGPGPVVAHNWVIDSAAPLVSLTSGPRGRVPQDYAFFGFGSGDPAAGFECRLDQGSFVACTSPHQVSGLADGDHRIEVRARDAAGNISPVVGRDWTVDTTGPATTLTEVPANGSVPGPVRIRFQSDDSGAIFSCRLDSSGWRPCASPFEAELAAGHHVFTVRATDSVGNAGPESGHEWNAILATVTYKPVIRLVRKVRSGKKNRVKVADLSCSSACRLIAPRSVKVKIGRKSITVPLLRPRGEVIGRRAVSIKVTARLKRALATARGRIGLALRASSAAGSIRVKGTVSLRR